MARLITGIKTKKKHNYGDKLKLYKTNHFMEDLVVVLW